LASAAGDGGVAKIVDVEVCRCEGREKGKDDSVETHLVKFRSESLKYFI
jgi:hypothetical protein